MYEPGHGVNMCAIRMSFMSSEPQFPVRGGLALVVRTHRQEIRLRPQGLRRSQAVTDQQDRSIWEMAPECQRQPTANKSVK